VNGQRDEITRLREAFAASNTAPDPSLCPSAETIWDAARGTLPASGLGAVLDHVASCASCAEDWRLAVAFEEEASRGQIAPVVPLRRPLIERWRPALVALAASLLLAVVGLQLGPWSRGPQEPTYREGERAGVRSLIAEGQGLPQERFVLRWSPVPGAASYTVLVSTEDLKVLATAEDVSGTQYQVPGSALEGLAPGTPILWQVKAVLPDGSAQTSPTFKTPIR
jgi:hypothetical protein